MSPNAASLGGATADGAFYNIYPGIHDPLRQAYYLPIIQTIYVPPASVGLLDEQGLNSLDAILEHEIVHTVLGNTVSVCQMRMLAAQFVALLVDFVTLALEDERIHVPSFRLDLTAQEHLRGDIGDDAFSALASQFGAVSSALELVHELVADLALAKRYGWEPSETLEFALSHVESGERTIARDFVEVYHRLGSAPAHEVARYAINQLDLTRDKALDRLGAAVGVSRTFAGDPPTDPHGALAFIARFTRHLADHLPDYEYGRCPIGGNCLGKAVEDAARAARRARGTYGHRAAFVASAAAELMNTLRCRHEDKVARGERPLLPQMVLEELKGLAAGRDETAKEARQLVRLAAGRQHIHLWVKPREPKHDLDRIISLRGQQPLKRGGWKYPYHPMNGIEALRQQMFAGQGPRCLCYPSPDEHCPFRVVLGELWKYSEADPDSDWKRERPACI